MKLYNMDKEEWRKGHFKHEDTWRSDSAQKCEICHTKTNKWHLRVGMYGGPQIRCPGDQYYEHEELEDAYNRWTDLKLRISQYKRLAKSTGRNADALIRPVEKEAELLLEQINALRLRFDCDDVVGEVKKVEMFEASCWGGGKRRIGQ
jgi:hypothetical protein